MAMFRAARIRKRLDQNPEREKVKPRAVYFETKQESLQSAGTPTYLKVRSHAVVIAGLGC